MSDEKHKEPQGWVTNRDLQLELKALRSDVKVWLLGAVALNQFLASVDLPSSLTAAAVVGFVANQNVSAPHVHEDKRRVA